MFAQTLTDEEIVVYSVTIDGAVTENWRFTPKVYADHPVQDVLSSLLRQEDFTPDYRQLVVVRKERAEPIGFETRVGLHALDGSFTDLSGYGESVPDKAVQSQPAVHHGTGRLWYWQYQNRATRLMSVGLDGEDRRHEEQIQAKMPRAVVGQPFYLPDSDVPVPTYEDGKVLVVTPDGTVGAKYVLAGAGAQIGDPYQIADAPKFESPGYELACWIDEATLLATGQDQIYRLTITGQRLAEQPMIAEQTPPWRRAIDVEVATADGDPVLVGPAYGYDHRVTTGSAQLLGWSVGEVALAPGEYRVALADVERYAGDGVAGFAVGPLPPEPDGRAAAAGLVGPAAGLLVCLVTLILRQRATSRAARP
ncbi:hypothetical protein [Micromonospora sp. Llam0]|uniref:hypothetical protein n=1 Tax=Micromonospora sp. Llam0 TaxID=2485143 RepID=UPI000F495B65|nr:hypothetical protein [Micromonospora sp. Llam0]